MKERKRHLIQAASSLLHNPHLSNFLTGKIHQGATKHICVPGLNCYSCPGAAGACPIGSLQAVMGGRTKNISYYVLGTVLLFGVLFGRLICGFVCPFGFVQDLLHKIPSPKPGLPKRLDKTMRWGKYIALAAVLILPAILTDAYGIGAPYFCKYVCPAGTLEGGVPLAIASEAVRGALGFLFSWKMAVLLAVIAGSVLLYRPFCKYLCPLGAIYGLLNRFSAYRMKVDDNACVHCGKCEQACKMGVKVTQNINSAECIRCGLCKDVCPKHAIKSGFFIKE
ncbi:MAG: 4Fe-4S binding protein [Eubacteriales bacterium]|jgi:ferredoxin-type protein NapH